MERQTLTKNFDNGNGTQPTVECARTDQRATIQTAIAYALHSLSVDDEQKKCWCLVDGLLLTLKIIVIE